MTSSHRSRETGDFQNHRSHEREEGDDTEKPPAKRQRKSNGACRRCHSYKIKCSGEQPCRNCLKSTTPVTCIYPVKDRNIIIKQSYVQQLEAEIATLRGSSSSSHPKGNESAAAVVASISGSRATTAINNSETVEGGDGEPGTGYSSVDAIAAEDDPEFADADADARTVDISRPLHLQYAKEGDVHVLSAYIGEAACEAFVTRVRQYMKDDETIAPPRHDMYFRNKNLLRLSTTTFQQLPDRGYAMLLVDVADRMVGDEYHMFLRKTFMQRLDELYESMVFQDPVWLCGMFAIFALGEMYSSTTMRSEFSDADIPGTSFFVQAMDLFQDLHEEPTIPYIEVILLLSYYSHALNRRNTAYTLTGLALRLSLTLGLHRDIPDQLASGLEREHRRRVWWTVYTLDRLCSLKLGHPIMIRDEDIDVKLPSVESLTPEEKEDLPDPQQLVASVCLARIAGNIVQELYCVSRPSLGSTFIQSVQKILLRLKSFAEGLPEYLRLDKIPATGCPGRALASLHVYFHHCIILTTRPILFYVFRSRYKKSCGNADQPTSGRPLSSLSLALAEACIHAATTAHSLLRRLWVNGLITMLGGFDAQYLFSSALILTLADSMTPSETNHSIVESAWSMLRAMGNNGNLSAKGFHDQLTQLKDHLYEENTRTNSKAPHNSVGINNSQIATDGSHRTVQLFDEQNTLRDIPVRPDSSNLWAYFNGVNNAADVLNNPNINDFLTYVDVNNLENTAGFEGINDPWKTGWEQQLLSSNFMQNM